MGLTVIIDERPSLILPGTEQFGRTLQELRAGRVQEGDFTLEQSFDNGFEPEYQAVLNYATAQGFTLPSAGQQTAQNAWVIYLKLIGAWDLLDILYNFWTNGDANYAKINWKAPGTKLISQVGTVNFTANKGFKKNANGSYLSINHNLSTGTNWKQNDAGAFFEMHDGPGTNQLGALLVESGVNLQVGPVYATDGRIILDINGAGSAQGVASIAARTFYHTRRNAAALINIYSDGIVGTNANVISQAPAAVNYIRLLEASFGNPYPATTGLSCFAAGASLIGLEAALYSGWNAYKAAA